MENAKNQFNDYLVQKGLSNKTIQGYTIIMNNIIEPLQKCLLDADEEDIINVIRQFDYKASTKAKYLLVPILYRNHNKLGTDKLGAEMKLMKRQETIDSAETNKKLKQTGITKQDVLNHLDNVAKELRRYFKITPPNSNVSTTLIRHYIVNYLIITYGIRNMDLNLYITNNKELTKYDDDNYLLVRSADIIYIRHKYKTAAAYGTQQHIITDSIFKRCCKYLLGQRLNSTASGKPISNIGRFVSDMTYNQLGEGRLYKIMIDDTQTGNGSLNKIKELAQSRGSNMNQVAKYYHIDAK
jgi:hypothetical protein